MEVVSDKLRSLYRHAQQMKWRKVRRRETGLLLLFLIYQKNDFKQRKK